MAFQVGEDINGYTLTERIGSGGMATVYKAYHARLDREVAIKVMHQTIAQETDFIARFEREARIVAQLEHPHIVPIFDFNEIRDQAYIVMRYIPGHTLKQYLEANGPLTLRQVIDLMHPVAHALNYAHQQGILHRDIKPSNIIINDNNGQPYITDFGLARIAQSGESTMSADVMLGTPHYISPEQAQGNTDLDTRTDVYSFAIILFEMIAGRVPFVGDTSYAIIHDQIYTPAPPVSDFNADVPAGVVQVLERALAKDRAQRQESPLALIEDLEKALDGKAAPRNQVRAVPPPAPPQPPRHKQKSRPGGIFTEIGDSMREAGEEVRRSLKEAGEEIRHSMSGMQTKWRPGTKWYDETPTGARGFFTDEEIADMRREINGTLTDEDKLRRKIEKRINERNDFYQHLGIYVAVNLFLWSIWLFSGAGFPWPIFPTLGWGIGVVANYMDYYFNHGEGSRRKEDMIERELERERTRQGYKRKNDEFYDEHDRPHRAVRLNEDGELTESTVDAFYDEEDQARR